jgi:phage baseplate assembly protein W
MSDILFSDSFAYDVSNDILSKGEIFDYDVIEQSLENILSTFFGERIFNPYFGSSLGDQLFELSSSSSFQNSNFLRTLIDQISTWENRITFITDECYFDPEEDNSISLNLSYVINKNNVRNTFKRKIRLPN